MKHKETRRTDNFFKYNPYTYQVLQDDFENVEQIQKFMEVMRPQSQIQFLRDLFVKYPNKEFLNRIARASLQIQTGTGKGEYIFHMVLGKYFPELFNTKNLHVSKPYGEENLRNEHAVLPKKEPRTKEELPEKILANNSHSLMDIDEEIGKKCDEASQYSNENLFSSW